MPSRYDRYFESDDNHHMRESDEAYFQELERRHGARPDERWRSDGWQSRSRQNWSSPRPGDRNAANWSYSGRDDLYNRGYYSSYDNYNWGDNRGYSNPEYRQYGRESQTDARGPRRFGGHQSSEALRRFGEYSSGGAGYSGAGYGGASQSSYGEMRSHFGKGPKGYVRSDQRIREDVCDRLSDDDEVDASEISVTVKDAEVTLEGSVPDRYSKRRAEDIAESVSGVRDVSNRLRTNKSFMRELGDKLAGEERNDHRGHAGSGTRNSTFGTGKSSSH